MRNARLLVCVVALAAMSACVDDAVAEPKIQIDPSATTTPNGEPQPTVLTAAWLLYAATKLAALDKLLEARKEGYVRSDDYSVELEARSALADYWREAQTKGDASANPYLDKLVEIAAAGFIEEYVLATFARVGWTVPPGDLAAVDFEGFRTWGAQHLVAFESETLSGVEPDSKRFSNEPPGSSLPDFEPLMPTRVPCARSIATLGDAAARWDVEARRLDGVAVAAKDRPEYIGLLAKLRGREPYQSRGMTLVDPNVAAVVFFAGYCSVDLQDFDAARPLLEKSVELLPLDPAPRFELAQVLIAQREFDRADVIVDDVLLMTKDRCDLGHGWRKRGYIRFEQGRLEEARAAYKLSLEYDPLSKIAPSELELLDAEIARNGGSPEPYKAPPALPQTVTACAPAAWL